MQPRFMRHALGLALLSGLFALPLPVGAEPVGRVEGLTPNVRLVRGEQESDLQNGQTVVLGDVITTDASGRAQLLFLDETRIVIGPNSHLVVERVLFDSSNTATDFTVGAVEGAFRFFSGKSDKSTYSIQTPNATMGIRGTEFDFTVSPAE